MNDELKICLDNINAIQREVLAHGRTKDTDRDFRQWATRVKQLGYVLKHRWIRDIFGNRKDCLWTAVPADCGRNSECPFVYEDNRPKYRKTLIGDCTTRAMAYCLVGKMTYDEIESRQYALAEKRHTRRNSTGTWKIVILENGWCELRLRRLVKRSVLCRQIGELLTKPAISLSSGHVAAIDGMGVHDVWDSRGGRVKAVFVWKDDVYSVIPALASIGVGVTVAA